MYYWKVKWKDYQTPPLFVSENQGKYINEMLEKPSDQRPERFKINGVLYRYDGIDFCEPSNKKVPDFTKLLYAGGIELEQKGPMINDEGDVVTNWYKKRVSDKDYADYYAKRDNFKLLNRDESGVWVAIRIVEHINKSKPEEYEICTGEEAKRLWDRV